MSPERERKIRNGTIQRQIGGDQDETHPQAPIRKTLWEGKEFDPHRPLK